MNILVIDSGYGGLPLLKKLKEKYQENNYTYIADTKHFPYGKKSSKQVEKIVTRIIDNFTNIDRVFLACNTASVCFLSNDKVDGVIKPVILEVNQKRYKNVTLFATKGTVKSQVYPRHLEANVFSFALSKLIDKIEKQEDYVKELEKCITKIPRESEALILGCTHFLLIKEEFKKRVNIDVICVDELI